MSASLLITVLGPTASGKTAFAARLAGLLDAEIISADSRQVYRKMDLGTGKDYSDYIVQGKPVPCHLIDIVDAGYQYSVFEYQRDFKKAWENISSRGKQAILCGGSGLYIEAVIDAYELVRVPHDTEFRKELESKPDNELIQMLASYRKLHNVSDTSSRSRLVRAIEIARFEGTAGEPSFPFSGFDNIILGLGSGRDRRRKLITARLDERLRAGLVDEVRQLLNDGLTPEELIFYGLEYKFITLYLTGRMTFDEMRNRLNTAIHQFAKRQMTWFRRMEKKGYTIHWLDEDLSMEEKLGSALSIIERAKKGP
jgi:tRNA dimethylallyltransferase